MKISEVRHMINTLGPRNGSVRLPADRIDVTETLEIDQPCIGLEGDIWAYSSDPNGVFESRYGTPSWLSRRTKHG